jgi:hypothetical protein
MVVFLLFCFQIGCQSLLLSEEMATGSNLLFFAQGKFLEFDNGATTIKAFVHANEQGSGRTQTIAISRKNPGRTRQENLRGQRLRPEEEELLRRKRSPSRKLFTQLWDKFYLYQREK